MENLRPVWSSLLRIYGYVSKICDEHGLRHYACFGTALGAVRHKGFIPWDDDFDIAMPRPDYEKFKAIAFRELPVDLVFFDSSTEPTYHAIFGKVQECRRDVVEAVESEIGRTLSNGLYIDIFPIDGYPSSKIGSVLWFVKHFILLSARRFREGKFTDYSYKGKAMWIVGAIMILIFPSIRKVKDFFEARASLGRSYPYEESERTVIVPSVSDKYVIHDKAEWGSPVYMLFEGIRVPLPANYDMNLKREFGNYMQLPPEEKRRTTHSHEGFHHPWWLGPTK